MENETPQKSITKDPRYNEAVDGFSEARRKSKRLAVRLEEALAVEAEAATALQSVMSEYMNGGTPTE